MSQQTLTEKEMEVDYISHRPISIPSPRGLQGHPATPYRTPLGCFHLPATPHGVATGPPTSPWLTALIGRVPGSYPLSQGEHSPGRHGPHLQYASVIKRDDNLLTLAFSGPAPTWLQWG